LGLVVVIELLSEGSHLAALELGDADRAPALGGPGHGAEHQLEDRLLAERVGDDLETAALLDEQAFQEIGRSGRAPVGDRQPEVGDARSCLYTQWGSCRRWKPMTSAANHHHNDIISAITVEIATGAASKVLIEAIRSWVAYNNSKKLRIKIDDYEVELYGSVSYQQAQRVIEDLAGRSAGKGHSVSVDIEDQ
jgi:hypothetical protein